MIILERQYEKNNPLNEQKRYVIISNWRHYKLFFIDNMDNRDWWVLKESENDKFVAEYKFKALDAMFIHEATVINKTGYLDGEVYVAEEDKFYDE